jgi:hypothetical protein
MFRRISDDPQVHNSCLKRIVEESFNIILLTYIPLLVCFKHKL